MFLNYFDSLILKIFFLILTNQNNLKTLKKSRLKTMLFKQIIVTTVIFEREKRLTMLFNKKKSSYFSCGR